MTVPPCIFMRRCLPQVSGTDLVRNSVSFPPVSVWQQSWIMRKDKMLCCRALVCNSGLKLSDRLSGALGSVLS